MEDKLRGLKKMVDEQALKSIHVSKTEEFKILSNLNKKTKQGNKLQYYISSIAALLLMSIIGYSFLNDLTGNPQKSNQASSVNGSSGNEPIVSENIFDAAPSTEDAKVVVSAAEQELIENMDSMGSLILSSYASIPFEKIKEIDIFSGEPKIETTKTSKNVILVKATFTNDVGGSITLMAKENKYGSVKGAIESLSSVYPDSLILSISGKDAIIYKSNGLTELLILEEKYVYSVSGGNDSSFLSSIAEQIVFSE